MRSPAGIVVALAFAPVVWSQEVTLPLESYEALRARSQPRPEASPRPPAPFAVEAALIDVSVAAGRARIVERLTLSLYAPGWQTIPISPTGSLTSAQLGGLEGRVSSGDGWSLVVRGRGRHEVRLEAVAPLTADEASRRTTRRIQLALPAAAAVSGSIRTGDDVEEVQLGPGGLARAGTGPHDWSFVGTPGSSLAVTLLGRSIVPERALLPLKFQATSATLARLSRTRMRVGSVVKATVLQGRLERLRIPLPPGLEIASVEAGEAGWDLVQGTLVVTPLAPVEGETSVAVELVGEPRDEMTAVVLVPEGASHATLLTGLQVEADGFPTVEDPGSGRLAEAAELEDVPAEMRPTRGPLFLVRDRRRLPRLSIRWSDEPQVLASQVDRLIVDALVGEARRGAYQCWAIVRNRGATSLTLKLPPGFELVAAERDGQAVTPGGRGEGFVVPLTAGENAQTIHLVGLWDSPPVPEDDGRLELPLPASSAPIARVEVRALLPGGRDYTLDRPGIAGRIGDVPIPPPRPGGALGGILEGRRDEVRGASPFAPPPGFAELQAAWSALATEPGPLALRVKPQRRKEAWF